MKRVISFILLLCHMNSSMFLPQMAEADVFDKNGKQADDINSVIEFVRVQLGYDKTADDEDDDSGQNFLVLKPVDYFFEQYAVIIERKDFTILKKPTYSELLNTKLPSISYDIISPPPRV